MDSLKITGTSMGTLGVWWLDAIPWALMVCILCLNIVYLAYKIKRIKE